MRLNKVKSVLQPLWLSSYLYIYFFFHKRNCNYWVEVLRRSVQSLVGVYISLHLMLVIESFVSVPPMELAESELCNYFNPRVKSQIKQQICLS